MIVYYLKCKLQSKHKILYITPQCDSLFNLSLMCFNKSFQIIHSRISKFKNFFLCPNCNFFWNFFVIVFINKHVKRDKFWIHTSIRWNQSLASPKVFQPKGLNGNTFKMVVWYAIHMCLIHDKHHTCFKIKMSCINAEKIQLQTL